MPLSLGGSVASSGVDGVGSDVLGSGTVLSLRVRLACNGGVGRVGQVESRAVPRVSAGRKILRFILTRCNRLFTVVREVGVELSSSLSARALGHETLN